MTLPFDAGEALRAVTGRDAPLAKLAARVPFTLQIAPRAGVFDALARSILYQQLNGKAAATIHGRFLALARPKADGVDWTSTPTDPRRVLRLKDTSLRAAGVSGNKVLAIRNLARKVQDGTVPPMEELAAMDDEAIVERLTAVRGIGRWTVHMLLIFRLGRPDVLPVDDYGVRQGFARLYRKKELPSPADLARRAERWRPYRTVGSWYMWRAVEHLPPRK